MRQLRIFLKTFGCQMNVRDSEFVAGLLVGEGFRLARSIDEADVVLFNSCSVRKHAEDRLFANIADLNIRKEGRAKPVVVLMGCTAQLYKSKAIDKAPLVDIVCGTGNEADLPRLIRHVLKKGSRIIATDKVDDKKPETVPEYREHKFKASVSISEGCDNFCSYCVVPYARGRERSRDARDIIKEVRGLADRGFKEIMLLGQNVNSYRSAVDGRQLSAISFQLSAKTFDFIRLLEELNKIDGIERIRFMTSHPKDAHADLFKAIRDLDKVCEHLHLPMQSGSDRILKLMNRGYTTKGYLKMVEDYRRIVPLGSITTDFIVGFPSETDRDFRKTCAVISDIGFDSAYTFKYSPRELTKAFDLKDNVAPDVKASRLDHIMNLQCAISEKRNKPFIGKTVDVLVEDMSRRDEGRLIGRTKTNKPAVFKGSRALVSKLVDIEVESVTPHALKGRMVE